MLLGCFLVVVQSYCPFVGFLFLVKDKWNVMDLRAVGHLHYRSNINEMRLFYFIGRIVLK